MSRFIDGIAKTNLLYCTDCDIDIVKGEAVVFELVNIKGKDTMKNCYCSNCSSKFDIEVTTNIEHPLSSEALGQE